MWLVFISVPACFRMYFLTYRKYNQTYEITSKYLDYIVFTSVPCEIQKASFRNPFQYKTIKHNLGNNYPN